MKRIIERIHVLLASVMLCVIPITGCSPATMHSVEAETYAEWTARADSLEESGDTDGAAAARLEADKIQSKANERQVGDLWDFVAGWIPGVPDGAKDMLKAPAVALIASAAFPRPRRHYLNAMKALGRSAVEINPIGSKMAPGAAVAELWTAGKAILAAPGLVHTETVEGAKPAPGSDE